MKVIGLIGGLSWESSAEYYRLINQEVHSRLGGSHSAKLLMLSVDFHELELLQNQDRWEDAAAIMVAAAQQLERGGAQCVAIGSNTMHRAVSQVEAVVPLPLLHIADATAEVVGRAGLKRVGLLGTRYTMEHEYYRGRLTSQAGLEVLIPPAQDRATLHRIIYEELIHGRLLDESRQAYLAIMERLASQGAEGIILGCTEISMLVQPGDGAVPLFDTTAIHARALVDWALAA
ncbi:MAG: aspartate/glutamate racemase family protein [Candidatus Marinimicrobia bacterium]|nr:aspartate/glutamate racemase family protein [Candidatus Neomarinimicrobiota bacterium]